MSRFINAIVKSFWFVYYMSSFRKLFMLVPRTHLRLVKSSHRLNFDLLTNYFSIGYDAWMVSGSELLTFWVLTKIGFIEKLDKGASQSTKKRNDMSAESNCRMPAHFIKSSKKATSKSGSALSPFEVDDISYDSSSFTSNYDDSIYLSYSQPLMETYRSSRSQDPSVTS